VVTHTDIGLYFRPGRPVPMTSL